MFEAIQNATATEYGASAILDVTSKTPTALDEMESFWLAETLKYFYLLFSDPGWISLDDYVLWVLAATSLFKLLTRFQEYRSTCFSETKVDRW